MGMALILVNGQQSFEHFSIPLGHNPSQGLVKIGLAVSGMLFKSVNGGQMDGRWTDCDHNR